MNIYILAAFTTVLSFQFHQEGIATNHTTSPFSHTNSHTRQPVTAQIKWTWQLPHAVRSAFNKSKHSNWYIEKMLRLNDGTKTVYRFFLNNGNLLDGDHHDCFLQSCALDIAEDGLVLTN